MRYQIGPILDCMRRVVEIRMKDGLESSFCLGKRAKAVKADSRPAGTIVIAACHLGRGNYFP